jgi:hypothetical protein
VALVVVALTAPAAMAAGRTLERKALFVGGSGTRADHDGSFKLSYLEISGDGGAVGMLNYQISSLKDTRLMVHDAQILGERDGKLTPVWKQTDSEKMGFIVDNLDPDPGVVKVYDKRKFFVAEEIPLDLSTGVVRWIVEFKNKTYNVDWNLLTNDITCQAVE